MVLRSKKVTLQAFMNLKLAAGGPPTTSDANQQQVFDDAFVFDASTVCTAPCSSDAAFVNVARDASNNNVGCSDDSWAASVDPVMDLTSWLVARAFTAPIDLLQCCGGGSAPTDVTAPSMSLQRPVVPGTPTESSTMSAAGSDVALFGGGGVEHRPHAQQPHRSRNNSSRLSVIAQHHAEGAEAPSVAAAAVTTTTAVSTTMRRLSRLCFRGALTFVKDTTTASVPSNGNNNLSAAATTTTATASDGTSTPPATTVAAAVGAASLQQPPNTSSITSPHGFPYTADVQADTTLIARALYLLAQHIPEFPQAQQGNGEAPPHKDAGGVEDEEEGGKDDEFRRDLIDDDASATNAAATPTLSSEAFDVRWDRDAHAAVVRWKRRRCGKLLQRCLSAIGHAIRHSLVPDTIQCPPCLTATYAGSLYSVVWFAGLCSPVPVAMEDATEGRHDGADGCSLLLRPSLDLIYALIRPIHYNDELRHYQEDQQPPNEGAAPSEAPSHASTQPLRRATAAVPPLQVYAGYPSTYWVLPARDMLLRIVESVYRCEWLVVDHIAKIMVQAAPPTASSSSSSATSAASNNVVESGTAISSQIHPQQLQLQQQQSSSAASVSFHALRCRRLVDALYAMALRQYPIPLAQRAAFLHSIFHTNGVPMRELLEVRRMLLHSGYNPKLVPGVERVRRQRAELCTLMLSEAVGRVLKLFVLRSGDRLADLLLPLVSAMHTPHPPPQPSGGGIDHHGHLHRAASTMKPPATIPTGNSSVPSSSLPSWISEDEDALRRVLNAGTPVETRVQHVVHLYATCNAFVGSLVIPALQRKFPCLAETTMDLRTDAALADIVGYLRFAFGLPSASLAATKQRLIRSASSAVALTGANAGADASECVSTHSLRDDDTPGAASEKLRQQRLRRSVTPNDEPKQPQDLSWSFPQEDPQQPTPPVPAGGPTVPTDATSLVEATPLLANLIASLGIQTSFVYGSVNAAAMWPNFSVQPLADQMQTLAALIHDGLTMPTANSTADATTNTPTSNNPNAARRPQAQALAPTVASAGLAVAMCFANVAHAHNIKSGAGSRDLVMRLTRNRPMAAKLNTSLMASLRVLRGFFAATADRAAAPIASHKVGQSLMCSTSFASDGLALGQSNADKSSVAAAQDVFRHQTLETLELSFLSLVPIFTASSSTCPGPGGSSATADTKPPAYSVHPADALWVQELLRRLLARVYAPQLQRHPMHATTNSSTALSGNETPSGDTIAASQFFPRDGGSCAGNGSAAAPLKTNGGAAVAESNSFIGNSGSMLRSASSGCGASSTPAASSTVAAATMTLDEAQRASVVTTWCQVLSLPPPVVPTATPQGPTPRIGGALVDLASAAPQDEALLRALWYGLTMTPTPVSATTSNSFSVEPVDASQVQREAVHPTVAPSTGRPLRLFTKWPLPTSLCAALVAAHHLLLGEQLAISAAASLNRSNVSSVFDGEVAQLTPRGNSGATPRRATVVIPPAVAFALPGANNDAGLTAAVVTDLLTALLLHQEDAPTDPQSLRVAFAATHLAIGRLGVEDVITWATVLVVGSPAWGGREGGLGHVVLRPCCQQHAWKRLRKQHITARSGNAVWQFFEIMMDTDRDWLQAMLNAPKPHHASSSSAVMLREQQLRLLADVARAAMAKREKPKHAVASTSGGTSAAEATKAFERSFFCNAECKASLLEAATKAAHVAKRHSTRASVTIVRKKPTEATACALADAEGGAGNHPHNNVAGASTKDVSSAPPTPRPPPAPPVATLEAPAVDPVLLAELVALKETVAKKRANYFSMLSDENAAMEQEVASRRVNVDTLAQQSPGEEAAPSTEPMSMASLIETQTALRERKAALEEDVQSATAQYNQFLRDVETKELEVMQLKAAADSRTGAAKHKDSLESVLQQLNEKQGSLTELEAKIVALEAAPCVKSAPASVNDPLSLGDVSDMTAAQFENLKKKRETLRAAISAAEASLASIDAGYQPSPVYSERRDKKLGEQEIGLKEGIQSLLTRIQQKENMILANCGLPTTAAPETFLNPSDPHSRLPRVDKGVVDTLVGRIDARHKASLIAVDTATPAAPPGVATTTVTTTDQTLDSPNHHRPEPPHVAIGGAGSAGGSGAVPRRRLTRQRVSTAMEPMVAMLDAPDVETATDVPKPSTRVHGRRASSIQRTSSAAASDNGCLTPASGMTTSDPLPWESSDDSTTALAVASPKSDLSEGPKQQLSPCTAASTTEQQQQQQEAPPLWMTSTPPPPQDDAHGGSQRIGSGSSNSDVVAGGGVNDAQHSSHKQRIDGTLTAVLAQEPEWI